MKNPLIRLFFLFLFFLQAPCLTAKADEISFKNGDRISGSIIKMENNRLVIKTPYAGNITVDWSEVINLNIDSEVYILLEDGKSVKADTLKVERGILESNRENHEKASPFQLGDIKEIDRKPGIKINFRLNAGLTSTDGNTEKNTKHFDGEFTARTSKNRYTAGADINTTEDSGKKTENNSLAYLKFDHFITDKWFAYGNSLFEKDKFKDLKLRSVLGFGSGYQFLETALMNLSLEAGINYVNEDYISAHDESFSSGRWSLNVDRNFYDSAFQLFHFHEGFISIEDTDDLFIKSRTGIRVPLLMNINASLQYNIDWEKSPSPGRKKADRELMFTLGYHFKN